MKSSPKSLLIMLSAVVMSSLFITGKLYAQQTDTTLVRYYQDTSDIITHYYYRKLLRMALRETEGEYGPFKVVPVLKNITQREAFRRLRVGEGVDVVYSMMSVAREWVLKAVKVPLSKGYIGCRLIMVTQADKNLFANVTNIDQLNKFRLGQEYDWPDTQILKANGVNVVTSETYDSLFTMLANHTIDGFPRGVYEINYEIKTHPKLHLAVANGIYLKYPTDMFFYVKKDNLTLASRIREGLLAGMKDGTFDRIFKENIQPAVDDAQLSKRHAIKLSNSEYYKLLDKSGVK